MARSLRVQLQIASFGIRNINEEITHLMNVVKRRDHEYQKYKAVCERYNIRQLKHKLATPACVWNGLCDMYVANDWVTEQTNLPIDVINIIVDYTRYVFHHDVKQAVHMELLHKIKTGILLNNFLREPCMYYWAHNSMFMHSMSLFPEDLLDDMLEYYEYDDVT